LKSLRSIVGLILFGVFILSGAANYVIQQFIILPSFTDLEYQEAQTDLRRCMRAVTREVEHLDTTCLDWSSWDDTYDFVKSRSKEYVESNLVLSTFTASRLNLIYVIDTHGIVVWGEIYDLETEEPVELAGFPKDAFPKTHPLISYETGERPLSEAKICGVFMTEQGPMLVSSRPILTSNDEGPARGSLIMGCFFNDEMVKMLVDQTQVPFKVFPVQDDSLAEPTREISNRITQESSHVIQQDSHLLIYANYPDIKNEPALLIKAKIPREISAKGHATMSYVLTSTSISALVVLILMLLLLQRTIIRPITALTEHALSIGRTGDLSRRLSMQRQDEIGTLGREFDRMLEQLMKTHSDLRREITERKRAEEELRKSESMYRMLIESTNSFVFSLDANGSFGFVNRFWTEKVGYSAEEIIGTNGSDLISADSMEEVRKNFAQVLKGEFVGNYEFRSKTRDGGFIDVLVNLTPICDSSGQIVQILGTGIDVTERKRAEEALRESEEHYRSLVENIELGVTLIDLDHNIIMTNAAQGRMFEKSPSDFVGKKCFREFEKRERMCSHCPGVRAMGTGHPEEVEAEGVRDDGSRFNGRIQAFPISGKDGRATGFIEVVEDITDKKKLEAQLQQAHKMEAIGTLAGGIAHDFNNVLGIILGNAELAMDEVPEWYTAQENLKEVRKACLRAKDMVKQILAFSRQTELERKPVKLSPIIKESVKLLRSSLPTTIDIRQHISAESDTVSADATQISQVLINFCTNAAHAMAEEGGLLEIGLEDLELDEDAVRQYDDLKPGNYVRLTVSDTGHGIEPEIMDRIFDPYFTTREVDQGTGMGLAVVHGIVKNHGGVIMVDSEPGKGATFRILLPAVESGVIPEAEAPEAVPGGSERILFVDDEQPLVNLAKKMLERLGYAVVTRMSSLEALEAFRAQPDKFDLVITDMTMPHMTGDKLAKEVIRIRPDIPIILCTGHSDRIDELRAKAMGIRAFVMKPFLKRDIATTVREVLDEK